jgi:hypothetical protein
VNLLIAGDQGEVGRNDAIGASYGAAAAFASDFLAELSELLVVLSEVDFFESDEEDDESDPEDSGLDFFDDELRLSVL